MKKEQFDDETLMAFADGELHDETAARIEAALSEDDALADRLAVFLDTRLAVANALKPLIHEPVPDALASSVRALVDTHKPSTDRAQKTDENVVALRPRAAHSAQRNNRPWLVPIAASILAVVTGIGGFTLGRGLGPTDTSRDAAIQTALQRQASGENVPLGDMDETIHIVSSFRDGNNLLCREYEVRSAQYNTTTVACQQGRSWVTRLALTSTPTEGFVPASSQETIDAYLGAIQAGDVLSLEDEKKALSATVE
jgi:hypothetical protein